MKTYDVLEVSRYIIAKGCCVSNLKLQSLLYFVQAYFLLDSDGKSGCFSEGIEAWDFGPVVPKAYREYKRYGSGNIPLHNYREDSRIIREDREKIDAVVAEFANYSTTWLMDLPQHQEPWTTAYRPYKRNEITLESIFNYFKE